MEEKEVKHVAAPGKGEEKPSTSPSPDLRKIIVFGHPHCGTTILKSIIGHCENAKDFPQETNFISDDQLHESHRFTVIKFPYMVNPLDYKDYVKIVILRNPLYVFSSLNKRFNFSPALYHQVPEYINALRYFHRVVLGRANSYRITYEDLFPDNHKKLKRLFDLIGLQYNDQTFDNSKFRNHHFGGCTQEDRNHSKKREAQINKPFVNMNDPSKVCITQIQKELLISNYRLIRRHFSVSLEGLHKVAVHTSE